MEKPTPDQVVAVSLHQMRKMTKTNQGHLVSHGTKDASQYLRGVKRKLTAPFQVEEVSIADANLALTDPMYHNQVRDVCKGVWSRRMRLSKPDVKVLVAANGKLSRLIDYRYYRIPDPEDYHRKYLRSRRVRKICAFKSHRSGTIFSGHPPTLVFDFLDRYRDGRISIDLGENGAHLYLGDFLDGAAKQLYNLITIADCSDISVVGWCTKVSWLLYKFSTDGNIQSTVQKLQDMSQDPHGVRDRLFRQIHAAT